MAVVPTFSMLAEFIAVAVVDISLAATEAPSALAGLETQTLPHPLFVRVKKGMVIGISVVTSVPPIVVSSGEALVWVLGGLRTELVVDFLEELMVVDQIAVDGVSDARIVDEDMDKGSAEDATAGVVGNAPVEEVASTLFVVPVDVADNVGGA